MDIERNTDVLHRELEVITRILAKTAVILFLVCCAVYAAPGKAVDAAKQVCAGVVDAERRNNCERDLMTTGELSFVQAYLATESETRRFPVK